MKLKNINLNQFQNFIQFYKDNKFKFNPLLSETTDKTISFCKTGNKIHIKEKNRGSFTRYCKGNVTEECIRKGKASPNPAIRKKATFAANARKFKH